MEGQTEEGDLSIATLVERAVENKKKESPDLEKNIIADAAKATLKNLSQIKDI